MSNILVTAIGSFSADVVIRSLHEMGHRIIGCDIYEKEWIANSLIADVFYQSPYASEEGAYIHFISSLCEEEKIDYIMPLTDVEVDVFNKNRDVFEDTIICISKKGTVDICRDKYRLYEYLKNHGTECLISTRLLDRKAAENMEFPAVIKPRDGRSSQGLNYVKDEKMLAFFMENNSLENYVVQPKINGNIVTVDILRNGDFFMATPRLELLRTLNGAGTSVKVFDSERLRNISQEIAGLLDIKGCVNFEFICTGDDTYQFLECNPRFSGGVAFSCMAGYDYVKNHLRCFAKQPVEDITRIQEMTVARKYTEYITKR